MEATIEMPPITFGQYLNGFVEWFTQNLQEIQNQFSPELKNEFETLEDFAVELYCEIISPFFLDIPQENNTISAAI